MRTLISLGVLSSVAATLPAQQTGSIKCKVDPGRAGVFVDGNYAGPAANLAESTPCRQVSTRSNLWNRATKIWKLR